MKSSYRMVVSYRWTHPVCPSSNDGEFLTESLPSWSSGQTAIFCRPLLVGSLSIDGLRFVCLVACDCPRSIGLFHIIKYLRCLVLNKKVDSTVQLLACLLVCVCVWHL
jgi:hypothetical protein